MRIWFYLKSEEEEQDFLHIYGAIEDELHKARKEDDELIIHHTGLFLFHIVVVFGNVQFFDSNRAKKSKVNSKKSKCIFDWVSNEIEISS